MHKKDSYSKPIRLRLSVVAIFILLFFFSGLMLNGMDIDDSTSSFPKWGFFLFKMSQN